MNSFYLFRFLAPSDDVQGLAWRLEGPHGRDTTEGTWAGCVHGKHPTLWPVALALNKLFRKSQGFFLNRN